MLVNYQKNWEGSSLSTAAPGVIVFYPLKDGVVKQIWLRVQEPVAHNLRWAVYYSDGGYITDFLITTGQVLGGSTLPDGFSVAMLSHLRVDLIETNGATAHIPIVFEIAIEEAIDISYNELQDVPDSFPPSAHNHDTRYYTKSETDAQSNNYELLANKNTSNGYCGLDIEGVISSAQLPPNIQRDWNTLDISITEHTLNPIADNRTIFRYDENDVCIFNLPARNETGLIPGVTEFEIFIMNTRGGRSRIQIPVSCVVYGTVNGSFRFFDSGLILFPEENYNGSYIRLLFMGDYDVGNAYTAIANTNWLEL